MLENIFWVYYPTERCPFPIEEITNWIDKFENRSCLLIGNVMDLSLHLAEKFGLQLDPIFQSKYNERVSVLINAKADYFYDDFKNLLACGSLLCRGGEREQSLIIHKKLVEFSANYKDGSTHYHSLKGLSWSYHLGGKIYRSLYFNFKALNFLKRNKINTDRTVGIDLIWISNQFYSLLKPHLFFKLPQLFLFPFIFILSQIYRFKGEKFYKQKSIYRKEESLKKLAYSLYYNNELFFAWANLFILIFGNKLVTIRKYIFRKIYAKQMRIEDIYNGFERLEDLFWMRNFEALFFAGEVKEDKMGEWISRINSTISSNAFSGKDPSNSFIYRSLILYSLNKDSTELKGGLNKALEVWDKINDKDTIVEFIELFIYPDLLENCQF